MVFLICQISVNKIINQNERIELSLIESSNHHTAKRARTNEQKQAKKQQIIQAADELFRESGFDAFSMGELCKRSSVAKGTLYLYFQTREEVLLELWQL